MAAKLAVLVAGLALVLVGTVLAAPKSAGSLFSPCSFKDPALNECMKKQATDLLVHLATGVKEWGLPPMDPLLVNKIELQNSGNTAVNLEMACYNFTFKGYKDAEIESLTFDPKTLHLEVLMTIPKFGGSGQYKTSGQILLLPISGEGYSEFSHEKPVMAIMIDFKRVEKGGKTFLKIDKCQYDYKSVVKIHTNFENLFGNKELSDNMNKVMNDNSQAMFRELKPAIDLALADLFSVLLAPMFNRIPLNELFKDTD